MKKWLVFVLAFIFIVTFGLNWYQNNVFLWWDEKTQMIVRETEDVSINDFIARYESGDFLKLHLVDDKIIKWFVLQESKEVKTALTFGETLTQEFYTVIQTQKPFANTLADLGISFTGAVIVEAKTTQKSILMSILEFVGPVILFMVVLFFAFRFLMPKGGGMPFNIKIGKLSTKAESKTRFKDIAGMHEVKAELEEIVDYLKNPAKYQKVWARHPKGVLLFGQPGSGKTLLARAVAGEASVPFFSASGSEFMEMLVGMGAAKVRELFTKAKAAWSAIIFIDEIDAIGKKRGAGHTGWHQEQEQTLNQILTEMDGFDNTTNVIVIAATNRPDTLDPALMRAGRFDRKIMVSRPTYEERILIFEYYLSKKKTEKDVSIGSLAKRTSGLVWADIENIVNEAALKVAKHGRSALSVLDFEYALEKVLMWPEKKIKSISDQEKKIVTFHELWHAVTAHVLPHADPVEKISIVSRGQALWVTWMMPTEDKYLYSKEKFLDDVVSLLWGRAAEEVFFGKDAITTGASNDFQRATRIIADMLTKYGMDDSIGTISYADDTEWYVPYKPYSEKTAEMVDRKMHEYMTACYEKSVAIISKNKKLMERMADVLLLKEYITREEFEQMMADPAQIDVIIARHEAVQKKILADAKKIIKN
jgi:cell division protease FtsH